MSDLRYVCLAIEHPRGDAKSAVHLCVATDSGRVRNIPLGRTDLLRLVEQASSFLRILEGVSKS